MSEPTKKKRPSYNYSNEDFTKVWNECTTVEEVSARTGMPKPSCQSKASILRKKGFALKMLQRGRRKTSVPEPEVKSGMEQLVEQVAEDAKALETLTPATADENNNGGADAA